MVQAVQGVFSQNLLDRLCCLNDVMIALRQRYILRAQNFEIVIDHRKQLKAEFEDLA